MPDAVAETRPFWTQSAPVKEYSSLSDNQETDVCVIGGGISGLNTAYLLALDNIPVILLESGGIASGETGRTTAHIASALDDRFTHLEKLFGRDGARLAAESHTAAIRQIDQIVRTESIDCGFEYLDGYLFAAPGQSADILHTELEAARRAGLAECEIVERAPLASFDTGPALRFPDQAQFHPVAYVTALAEAFVRRGGKIYTQSHVTEVYGGNPATVVTSTGPTVRAHCVVVATNTPINDRYAMHTKQAPYRTYAIGAEIPAGSVPRALYWDTLDPYHYVRTQPLDATRDLLIIGGEDHKTGQGDESSHPFAALEEWARARFPMIAAVPYRWSGQVMEPVDSLAFIGRNPGDPNIYIVTGDSGHGMTHGTIGGMLIRDLIIGSVSPWEPLYAPDRKPVSLSALKEYVKENANVAAQYLDWLKPAPIDSPEKLGPGQAAVIGAQAFYRDQTGYLHQLSASCPHLHCEVAWNDVERSWDCPCHGSRFDYEGNVLNGPATSPLEKIQAASRAAAP